jgi:hypothetical protein
LFLLAQQQGEAGRTHMQTLIIYKLGFNQIYYTLTIILLMNIALCSNFPCTEFIDYQCFVMSTSGDLSPSTSHGESAALEAHIRQSRLDSCIGFQVNVLKHSKLFLLTQQRLFLLAAEQEGTT